MNLISSSYSHPAARTVNVTAGVVIRVLEENETGLRESLAQEVAARSGLPSEEVEIISGSGIQPRVAVGGSPSAKWHVSLSHTHRCITGVVSFGRVVGVDVEWIDPKFEWKLVAAEFFPPEWAATWNQRLPHEARRKFFQHWVRWEAALKCRGTGFGATHLPPATVALGLSLFDLNLGTGYAGCLALAP
jgi:phosphopantetheinyl transferase